VVRDHRGTSGHGRRRGAQSRLTACCRRSSFHLDAISGVPYASTGHRSSKHERLTPLSRRLSGSFVCEPDDPTRTMLPCQHLAVRGVDSFATPKPREPQDYLAVQIRANLL
jgi:hypothetical protein